MRRQRVITVPKDKEAEQALDYDEAKEDQLIELLLRDEEFNSLYENGVFSLINDVGETNIDDYEDDSVTESRNIKRVITALKLKEDSCDIQIASIIEEIRKLFEEALTRNTGVYFYF